MQPSTVFHCLYLDVGHFEVLTPVQAKALLHDAFQCGYETCTDQKAREVLSNISLVQKNLISKTLSGAELWGLFELDPEYGPHEEDEPWQMPGYSMNETMLTLKKSLFERLYPGVDYESSDINGSPVE
jgi:hypothetical protein